MSILDYVYDQYVADCHAGDDEEDATEDLTLPGDPDYCDPFADCLWVCLYKDSTGQFEEDELQFDNLVDLPFPERIVAEWYEDHVKDDYDGPGKDSYEYWFQYESTADDTDGLYQFALERGWDAINPKH